MHRACVVRSCGRFAQSGGGRCAVHIRSTSARGYGLRHQVERRQLARTLPALCIYGCGRTLQSGDQWVAAHYDDRDPASPRGVACPGCNQRAKDGQLQPVVALGGR